MGAMKFKRYSDHAAFDELRSEWNELVKRSRTNTLFLTWEWQKTWWETFGAEKQLWIGTLRDEDERLLAIVPLFSHRVSVGTAAPGLAINIEKPQVTDGDTSMQALHLIGGSELSDYLDIIAPPEVYAQAWTATLEGISASLDWDLLDLRNVPAASPTLGEVTRLAEGYGWEVRETMEDVCPVVDLPGDWDEYLSTKLSKKQRHELRRKMRRADQDGASLWAFVTEERFDEGFDTFIRLHKSSDRDKESFMDLRMEGFFRQVSLMALDRDWLRLSILSVAGRPVASYLCFDYGGDRLVYNSGFDPSVARELSPGIALMGHLIADAIRRGCRRLDFLQGDERYKYEFGATDAAVSRLMVFRRKLY